MGGVHAERPDQLAAVLEHEDEVPVPFDRGAEFLLQVVDSGWMLGRQPAPFLDDDRHSTRDRLTVLECRRPNLHRDEDMGRQGQS